MKKKKEKIAHPQTTATDVDVKSIIHDHALFFDKLIELIPARFYLSNDDVESKPWFQGLSKAAKASAKQQTKDNIKKARRHRLDPEKSQSSTLDLLTKTLENKSGIDDSDDDNEVAPKTSGTIEELRQRLNRKLKEFSANRGNGERKREKRDEREKKRKRVDKLGGKSGGGGRDGKFGKSGGEFEKEVAEATKGIEFGKVKIGGEEDGGRKKKRKLSKATELERAKRLEEAKKDPERGDVVAKKHSWSAATSRAAGIKVHDDSKLLKHSMQKEKKQHEKNAQKWKERVESREKMKGEKQQKRAGNIAERIHQKKMRKIAKREKKLMRPGFEGRKEGYINKD